MRAGLVRPWASSDEAVASVKTGVRLVWQGLCSPKLHDHERRRAAAELAEVFALLAEGKPWPLD